MEAYYNDEGGCMFTRSDLKLEKLGKYGYTSKEMQQLEKFCEPEEDEGQAACAIRAERRHIDGSSQRWRSARLLAKLVAFFTTPVERDEQ